MEKNPKKIVFRSKYIDEDYSKEGRKSDSNFYRMHLRDQKVAYIQFLVKNIDQLIIMSSIVEPVIRPHLLDRFLVFAQYHQVKAYVFITKTDRQEEAEYRLMTSEEVEKIYSTIGYETWCFSNYDNPPIDKIRDILKDKRTAIIGHSGVGKTTMMNAVDETYQQKIQTVSEFNKRGKHTTTKIRMHELYFGGVVYDMPGLKELSLVTISKRELQNYFVEFQGYLGECFFRDCLHSREDRCGVKNALKAGKISPLRYNSYLEILEELPIN